MSYGRKYALLLRFRPADPFAIQKQDTETAGDAPAVYEVLKPFGVARWSLFFLISVWRGKVLHPLSPCMLLVLFRRVPFDA